VKYGRARRGTIGIYPTNITPTLADGLGLPQTSGVLVEDILSGNPAAEAGVKIGDILASVDNRPMRDTRELALVLFRKRPGEVVRLGLISDGQPRSVDVKVTESRRDAASLIDPANAEQYVVPRLGALAMPIDDKLAQAIGGQRLKGGVLVVARTFGTAADEVNIKPGDIIYAANHTRVDSTDALKSFMLGLKSGDAVVLQIERSGQLEFLSFRFEE
jgi:serine protease Do